MNTVETWILALCKIVFYTLISIMMTYISFVWLVVALLMERMTSLKENVE